MFAAVRSGAGWLLVGTALGVAGCSAIPLPDIGMPALPGFGPREIPAAMEPIPLAVGDAPPVQTEAAAAAPALQGERPAFFVQWRANMPGLTRKPGIASTTSPPEYPEDAAREGDEGTTTLDSCVTVEGRLVDVKLAKSSGSVDLDSATLAWARTAKFTPAEIDGQPMAICGYRVDHEWRVEDR